VRIDVVFAGIPVSDFEFALAFYERLFARPADIVAKDDEVMWRVTDTGWLYLVGDPGRAGRALVTLAVDDLDEAIAGIKARGLDCTAVEVVHGAGRKACVIDPEGNTVTFAEVEPASV
jgi:predicted enzyme related to lactoylglutathione lyase